jgi:hypothetical protein
MDLHGSALDPEPDTNSYKIMDLDLDRYADPHFTGPQQRFFY